jgi:transposase
MSKSYWLGIDVSKQAFEAAAVDAETPTQAWARIPGGSFAFTPEGAEALVAWCAARGLTAETLSGVCVESTGRLSRHWVQLLAGRLGAVCIVNPAQVKAFGKGLGLKDKTDRVDARVLALFGRTTRPVPAAVRGEAYRELQELSRLHQALQEQCQANAQRLNDGPASVTARAVLQETIEAQRAQLARLETAMDAAVAQDEGLRTDVQRACTVLGVGPATARVVFGELGDLRAYGRNEVAGAVGLFPKHFDSGTSVHKKPRLAKGAGARVRKALYMAALSARRYDPSLSALADRLERRPRDPLKPLGALGAVMRKLLLRIRAVVVSGKDYDRHYQPGAPAPAV